MYHFVLTYSNWETGTVCFAESYESLSEGLQNALWELGGADRDRNVPKEVTPKELGTLFEFMAEKLKTSHMLIFRPDNRTSMVTVTEARFNIAMQSE